MPDKNASSSEGQKEVSDTSQYLNKVASIGKQLVDINNRLTADELVKLDDADLCVRLDYIESLNSQFERAVSVLEDMGGSDMEDNTRVNFMATYFDVKAKIKRKISVNLNSRSTPHSSTVRQFSLDESLSVRKTRLPELKIPQFSGSYTDWPDFFAMFTTVIANDMDLSKIEKLQHLRASLMGAALDTISSLEPTDANYDKAIVLLKKRFDNKLLNFQTHIKEIFGLKGVDKCSAASLRQLSDKLNAHMRALETICSQKQIADGLLIYIVTSKLDSQSQAKWEEGLLSDQLPTWSTITLFLERRCRMLENLEGSMMMKIPSQQESKKANSHNRNVLVASGTISPQCAFCDTKNHYITNCSRFGNLSPTLRFKEAKRLSLCLNCLRKGHRLWKCKSGPCRHCSMKHHSLLHMDNNNIEPSTPNLISTSQMHESQATTTQQYPATTSQTTLVSSSSSSITPKALESQIGNNVLLATAIVLIKNKFGVFVPCRAILDSASQLNFITSRFASQIQLKVKQSHISISGIGDGNFIADKSADVLIKSYHGDYSVSFTAVVIPTITEYQPNTKLDVKQFKIPDNVKLADPEFYKCGRIDILIGAGLFFELMSVGQLRFGNNSPILQKTRLGWVVSGGGVCTSNSISLSTVCTGILKTESEALVDVVKSFWEVEHNFGNNSNPTTDEAFCEQHFQQNVIRLDSGEYSISLPKKLNIHELGNSYDRALSRFMSLEKKLSKHPDIKNQYISFMIEYADLKHMSLVTNIPKHVKTHFLPHHCVHKEDSTTTKLRVVFDGSAKTTTGISLNEILHSGPTIQPKLFDTLMRFRFFKIALSGDICKMYRCVRVSHPDDFLQCILWRNSPDEDINIYKLDTLTYGTKPAAFLAIRAMHQLSSDEEKSFPIGANVVRRDFYVDDLISGGQSVQEVIEIRQQVTELLKRGNFEIRKWCSNDVSVLNGIPSSDRETFLKFHDGTDITKTLGLVWDPKTDKFLFTFSHVADIKNVSKRTVLSSIARFYDPLGLIGPIITKAKVYMQNLWKCKLDWDESLPQALHSVWLQFVSAFSLVHKFIFPRFVSIPESTVQIHAFCDASLSAYGACVYVRSDSGGNIKISLLCSKSRVAPLKVLTVPKLELSAALLLSELLEGIMDTLDNKYEYHCWSDSMVVLSWLREESSNYNIFVANRVSRIQKLTNNMLWHHVPTASNPADILSRGATPQELLNSNLWKEGPDFLYKTPEYWPKAANFMVDLPERRRVVLITSSASDFSVNCKYHNSFPKIKRIFAYTYRFLNFTKSLKCNGELTPQELKMGIQILIRNIQFVHFATEYKALQHNKEIRSSSQLYSLMPFMDREGLIRVGGRLQNSFLNYEAQHPIILPKHHPVTTSLVLYYHQQLLHAGPQCLLANIRQQYWPIGGRKIVSTIIGKCIKCFRLKPKIAEHIMGSLPEDRVQPKRAFYTTGIDFCGPFYYKSDVRNRPPTKCYVCIYVCFTTKATHFELVHDLSTSSFLSSLKRFISIRGKPRTIWSDNATNFVGAKNELAELRLLFFDQIHMKKIHQQCLEDGINWKFIPPRSPHFGGLWEAAVKSAKYHFYRTVGLSTLTFDELRTLVCQISAVLNSRPLCPISENPADLEVLTPAHFLVGAPLTTFFEPDITEINISRLSRWQRVCLMQQVFWKKWSSSYLTLLQERSKWRSPSTNLTIGTMVLVKDENLPPLKWQLGRIVEVVTGKDGTVRVALVKTINGTSRRSVAKLAVLPIEDNYVESHNVSTGGGCSFKPLCQQHQQ